MGVWPWVLSPKTFNPVWGDVQHHAGFSQKLWPNYTTRVWLWRFVNCISFSVSLVPNKRCRALPSQKADEIPDQISQVLTLTVPSVWEELVHSTLSIMKAFPNIVQNLEATRQCLLRKSRYINYTDVEFGFLEYLVILVCPQALDKRMWCWDCTVAGASWTSWIMNAGSQVSEFYLARTCCHWVECFLWPCEDILREFNWISSSSRRESSLHQRARCSSPLWSSGEDHWEWALQD